MLTPTRREIAFVVAIVTGIVIGRLIKKVTVGMLIGLILGLIAAMLMANRGNDQKNDMNLSPDEKPPFFKSWNSWYVLVIGFLGSADNFILPFYQTFFMSLLSTGSFSS